MTTPDIQSLVESVLPCPCCGAAASLDRHRSFRLFETGEFSEGISISCCECPLEMMLCREDIQQTDDTIIAYLVRKWNARVESADLTRLRAELAEEKRKVGLALLPVVDDVKAREGHQYEEKDWNPDCHVHIELRVREFRAIRDILAALTAPSEKGETK